MEVAEKITEKIKVAVGGYGTVDECDHCGTQFTTGVACYTVADWKPLDLCHTCLDNYYEEELDSVN